MSSKTKEDPHNARVPAVSRSALFFFLNIVRLNLRRSFHKVRIEGAERFRDNTGPIIIYMNHASWWDPMIGLLLWKQLPGRNHYGPMEAASLDRYKILSKIGVFPVDSKGNRGGLQFIRTAEAILRSGGVLWVTPQGRFADVRERPPVFKAGLASLVARVPDCTLIPLAMEYPFWDERTPEALLFVGQPQHRRDGEAAADLEARLAGALGSAMEELERRARTRNPAAFSTILLHGRAGVGGFYGLGQRLRAFLLRRPYQAEHTVESTFPKHPEQTES